MLLGVGLMALWISSQFPSSPPAPPEVCTVAGLGLLTTAMSETAAWDLAKAKWGPAAFHRRLKLGNALYSIVEVGFRTPLDAGRDPEKCLVGLSCFQNRAGSWRKLWNSIWIEECERRQPARDLKKWRAHK